MKSRIPIRPIIQLEAEIIDSSVELPNNTAWQFPDGPNKRFVPDETPKREVARRLGCKQVS